MVLHMQVLDIMDYMQLKSLHKYVTFLSYVIIIFF